MQKKLRLYFWLVSGIVRRHFRVIITSFIGALFLGVVGNRFGPVLVQKLSHKNYVVGLVGAYSPTNLPVSLQRLISIGLTDTDQTGAPIPALATHWEVSSDGKEYTFHLRDDITWHDQKKFTAYDVNYNLKDVEFVPVNDTLLQVKLKEPFYPLLTFLTKPIFRKGLIGSGSYKMDALRLKGDTLSYLKLVPVTSDLPLIEIKFYASEKTAKTAFKLGEVNSLEEINDPTPFTGWATVTTKEIEKRNQLVAVFLNMNDSFLKTKEMRQALAFSLDKPDKNRVATPLSNKSWAYTNRVKQYDKDISSANKLLSDIKKSSSSAELTLSTFASHLQLAQNIAATWTSVGIATKVKVETGMPETFQTLLATQEIPIDPDQYTLWHSTQQQANISHYANPKIDKLLEDGRKEQNLDKRKKIYQDFQRYLVEDVPAIFLNHPTTYTISRK